MIIHPVTTCLLETVPFYLQSHEVWNSNSDLLSRKAKNEGKKKGKLTSGRAGYLLAFIKLHTPVIHRTGTKGAPKVLFPH